MVAVPLSKSDFEVLRNQVPKSSIRYHVAGTGWAVSATSVLVLIGPYAEPDGSEAGAF